MKYLKVFVLLSLLSVLGTSYSFSQEKITEKQIDKLFKAWDNEKSPGMGIGVVSKGELVFSKGYGMANLEHNIPISSNSVFDIASVSKQFTGMAIAMLIQDGLISESDDIRKYLPDFPDYGHTITVGNLLHHTSGIRDWPTLLLAAGYKFDDVLTFDLITSIVYNQKELNFIPGDEYVYSNSNYSLLVQILEKVTGDKFDSWMRNNIFKPLGMNDSYFRIDHSRIVKNKVDSYAPVGGNMYINVANNLCGVGSSSLFTTVEDLSKWVINLGTQKFGGKEILEMMTEKGELNNGDPNNYGFGIDVSEYKGHTVWAHSGGWAGFRTFVLYIPGLEFGVIELSNNAGVKSSSGVFSLINLYYPDLEEKLEPKKDSVLSLDPFKESDFSSALFAKYEGSYELEVQKDFVLTFTREGDKYFSQATGQDKFPLFPSSDSTFFLKVVRAYVTFHMLPNGTVDQITLHQNGHLKANRVEESEEVYDPSKEDLQEYIGDFSSEELYSVYSLQIYEGNLIIDHLRHGKLILIPNKKDHFSIMGWPGEIIYERGTDGKIISLRLNMMPRSRNILFQKVAAND